MSESALRETDGRPTVSVVIPVYDDARRLDRCMRALERQAWPKAAYEVIVVDNGSPEPVTIRDDFRMRTRVIEESRRGSYAARNTGAAAAVGQYLAFTDADCIPSPRWLEHGVAACRRADGPAFAGGAIEVFVSSQRPSAVELYERALAFPQERNVREAQFSVTANLFVPARLFERIGGFDPALLSGGDREWCGRAVAAGARAVFAPDAVVRHPARAGVAELKRKLERVARGHHMLDRANSSATGVRNALRIAGPPVRNLVTIATCDRLAGPVQRWRAGRIAIFAKYYWAFCRLRLWLRHAGRNRGA